MRQKKNPLVTVSDPVGNSSPPDADVKTKNAYRKSQLSFAKNILRARIHKQRGLLVWTVT